jgi:hypothetical protein
MQVMSGDDSIVKLTTQVGIIADKRYTLPRPLDRHPRV